MTLRLSLLASLAALAIAGCSTTPTNVDTGPLRARSFSFLPADAAREVHFASNRRELHAAIQEAISQNLTAKGLRPLPTGGDVTVAYLVVVGNNTATAAINDYFGYNPDEAKLVAKAHEAYAVDHPERGFFEAGTLLIDLVDPATHQLLRRRYVTRPILRETSAEIRRERIQEAVNEALQDVTIAP